MKSFYRPLCVSPCVSLSVCLSPSLTHTHNRPSAFKVAILLADTRLSFPLAIYISKAFGLRANNISNAILAWSGIVSHMLLYCCLLLSLICVLPRALARMWIFFFFFVCAQRVSMGVCVCSSLRQCMCRYMRVCVCRERMSVGMFWC